MRKVFLAALTVICLTPAFTSCSSGNPDGTDGFRKSMDSGDKETPEETNNPGDTL